MELRTKEDAMGLLDVLNGMENGPRGPKDPTASGGMSPITMAVLALLAYKAVKHVTGSTGTATAPAGGNSTAPGSTIAPSGGMATGGLSGGLNDLLKQFQDAGHGEAANSWVSPGTNKPISSDDLASALGADQINTLTSQTGLSRNELLEGLAQQLPNIVHQLTPDGRLPNEQEVSRWL